MKYLIKTVLAVAAVVLPAEVSAQQTAVASTSGLRWVYDVPTQDLTPSCSFTNIASDKQLTYMPPNGLGGPARLNSDANAISLTIMAANIEQIVVETPENIEDASGGDIPIRAFSIDGTVLPHSGVTAATSFRARRSTTNRLQAFVIDTSLVSPTESYAFDLQLDGQFSFDAVHESKLQVGDQLKVRISLTCYEAD